MELSPRKQAVLKAVVKTYIETGEPVGSKVLTAMLENAPSPATLRNEMSELCSLGFLQQPHTSAGRIPTSSGFQLYVNSLMSPDGISASAKHYIDAGLENLHCDAELLPSVAGKLLSELTGLPVLTCYASQKTPRIKKIEFLPISRNTVMLLLITADGRTRNRIFRSDSGFPRELTDRFREIAKKRLHGRPVNELTRAFLQSVIASSGLASLELMPLLTAVFELAAEMESSHAELSGQSYLYRICPDEETVRRILSLVERREPILSLLSGIDGSVGLIFGSDTPYRELSSHTVVAAGFSCGEQSEGAFGVIGPNRMSYDQIIPSMEYTAHKLSEIMARVQKETED